MKYKELIGKKINVNWNEKTINSYKITEISPTTRNLEGRGLLYKCSLDWENKDIEGAFPILEFDTKTLDELLEKGLATCPGLPNLYYVRDNKEK